MGNDRDIRRGEKVGGVPQSYEYWAFISYSSKDRQFARKLHHALENYGVPSQLKDHRTAWGELVPKRLRPIFCDREELPASADLGRDIRAALAQSRFLIVVCSPDSAGSAWVNREVETFRDLGAPDRILAVILRGEPNSGDERECFPPALKEFEPIAADVRKSGDGPRNAKLKLLAGILGVKFDVLKRRDELRRRKIRGWLAATTAVLLAAFGSLAWYAGRQRQLATEGGAAARAAGIEKATAEEGRMAADRQARRQSYFDDVIRMEGAWKAGDIGQIRTLLAKYEIPAVGDDLRGFEWHYWNRLANPVRRVHRAESALISQAWAADGKTLLAVDMSGKLRSWGPDDVEPREVLKPAATTARIAAAAGADRVAVLPIVRRGDLGEVEVFTSQGAAVGKARLPFFTSAVALSPDGSRLAVGDIGGGILMFDAQTGELIVDVTGGSQARRNTLNPLAPLDKHGGAVAALAFSRDGKRLASGGFDGVVFVWDAATGKCERASYHFESAAAALAFSPDGSKLVGRSLSKGAHQGKAPIAAEVIVWEAATGEVVCRVSLEGDPSPLSIGSDEMRLEQGAFNAEFIADGKEIVAAVGSTVLVFDASTGERIRELRGHAAEVVSLRVSPDGEHLATGDRSGQVNVWDLSVHGMDKVVSNRPTAVRGMAITASGPVVLEDQGVQLRVGRNGQSASPSEGKRLKRLGFDGMELPDVERPFGAYHGLVASPGGRRLAVITLGSICVFDAESGKLQHEIRSPESDGPVIEQCVAFRSDDELVCVGPETRTVRFGGKGEVVEVKAKPFATGGPLQYSFSGLRVPPDAVMSLTFSPDGRQAAVGRADGELTVYDLDGWVDPQTPWKRAGSFRAHSRGITGIAFSGASGRLATCSGRYYQGEQLEPNANAGEIIVWDLESLVPLLTMADSPTGEFAAVAFGHEGRTLYAAVNPTDRQDGGTASGSVVAWHTGADSQLAPLRSSILPKRAVSPSPPSVATNAPRAIEAPSKSSRAGRPGSADALPSSPAEETAQDLAQSHWVISHDGSKGAMLGNRDGNVTATVVDLATRKQMAAAIKPRAFAMYDIPSIGTFSPYDKRLWIGGYNGVGGQGWGVVIDTATGGQIETQSIESVQLEIEQKVKAKLQEKRQRLSGGFGGPPKARLLAGFAFDDDRVKYLFDRHPDDSEFTLWNGSKLETIALPAWYTQPYRAVFSPKGTYVVAYAGDEDNQVAAVISTADRRAMHTTAIPGGTVAHAEVSNDEERLVTVVLERKKPSGAPNTYAVVVSELRTGKELRRFSGFSSPLVRLSPDGRHLVRAEERQVIVETAEERRPVLRSDLALSAADLLWSHDHVWIFVRLTGGSVRRIAGPK